MVETVEQLEAQNTQRREILANRKRAAIASEIGAVLAVAMAWGLSPELRVWFYLAAVVLIGNALHEGWPWVKIGLSRVKHADSLPVWQKWLVGTAGWAALLAVVYAAIWAESLTGPGLPGVLAWLAAR